MAAVALVLGFCLAPWESHAAAKDPLWQEPGVVYERDLNPRIPLAVHVVRIDRAQKDLEFHTTMGGRDKISVAVLSAQAGFIDPTVGKAVAAINGDYFFIERPFVGDPMNLQILRGGELVSAPGADRAFFYLDAKGEPHVTNAVSQFTVTWPDGKVTPVGLNQLPETGQAVLYTRVAGATTGVKGIDLILEQSGPGPWLPLRIGQTLKAKVRQVNPQGFSTITPDSLVLSLSPKTTNQLPPLAPGLELKISIATNPDLSGAMLAIGGGPTLVRDGKARTSRDFTSLPRRDPRSAMGWNGKYFYFVQADGRQPRYSMGMTLEELANYFVKLECTYAINLDGGGSCTTWLAGKTVNSPSQGGVERPSANALVVVRKNKSAP